MFDSLSDFWVFVLFFYGTLSKNDHAVSTCWPDQTKPQNPVLFHMELCCGPCYLLEQWMGLPRFSMDQGNTQKRRSTALPVYSGNIKRYTTAGPRNVFGSCSRITGAQQPERAVRPYWGISTQKRLKIGGGEGSGNSMPWVTVGVWCFAPTAGLWWSGTLLF